MIKDYLIGFILIGLFVIAFIGFGIQMGTEHSAEVNLNNDSRINLLYSGINSTIYSYQDSDNSLQSEANSTFNSFNSEDTTGTGGDGIFFSTITSVGKSIMGVGFSIFDVIWSPILKIIFPNNREVRVVISIVLSTILLFLITLLAWRLYRVGE